MLLVLAAARPARAAQTDQMYWACSYNTRTQPSAALYVSDVTGPFSGRTATNYTNLYMERDFSQAIRAASS
jgi:hypothetical protein